MSRFTLVLFALVCIIGSCFAFGQKEKEDKSFSQLRAFVGLVGVYGNEPHTWLGFTDQQGVAYKLDANHLVLEELRNLQGVLLEIWGFAEKSQKNKPMGFQNLPGGTLKVQRYTLYKSSQ